MKTPSFFPILSLLPQRALVYIKSAYPSLFVPTFLDIYSAMWEHGEDVSQPDKLATVLSRKFNDKQVSEIIEKAKSSEVKAALNKNTKEPLEQGAFGCPWFWVRNSKGEEGPFFGSDR